MPKPNVNNAAQLARDVEDYERMRASRPRKPPPGRPLPPRITAGQAALQADRKLGLCGV